MNLEEQLDALASPGKSGSDTRYTNTPENWRAKSEFGTDGGFAVSTPKPLGQTASEREVLIEHGTDPDDWVVTSVRMGRWQTYSGEWLESKRVTVVPSREAEIAALGPDLDMEKLVDEIKAWRPDAGLKTLGGNGAYVFAPSDQQIGKKAGGQGTPQSVARLQQATDAGVQRLLRLRMMGLSLGTIVMPLPGDHVEGNVSQGGRLQGLAASDLGQTQQVRVARRLLLGQVKAFAPLAERMIVPVVNGNHDEVTRQVAADPADGWNVEIASAVQDACAENPALQHVEFRYPATGHQTLTVDVNGSMLGLFHGHQYSKDVEKYLSGQTLGQTALGGADVWMSGHYHHFKSLDIGDRFWVQCPTTDPGSDWYRDRTGATSRPGVLTMVIGGEFDPREFLGVLPVA